MGNFSQLTIGLETYQVQVATRLLEADSEVRSSLGLAADHVGATAWEVLKLIEQYYEAEAQGGPATTSPLATLNRALDNQSQPVTDSGSVADQPAPC